jgi:hypothetical protein
MEVAANRVSKNQTLTDLNDFITPSQACIKPVEQTNAPPKQEQEKEPGAASVRG